MVGYTKNLGKEGEGWRYEEIIPHLIVVRPFLVVFGWLYHQVMNVILMRAQWKYAGKQYGNHKRICPWTIDFYDKSHVGSFEAEFIHCHAHYTNLCVQQELHDVEGEAKACHFLGYAHYCLGNFREAVRYYDQDLALAKDLQDKMNMGRAYCNLGLAHLALGNLETALECQKYFLGLCSSFMLTV